MEILCSKFLQFLCTLTRKNDNLNSSLNCLRSENEILKSNASMPCNSCVASNDDPYKARDEIALIKSNASLPCGSCESLLAEINELKLTHTTCVNELEHARAEICEMKYMSCSTCHFILDNNICQISYDNHDT